MDREIRNVVVVIHWLMPCGDGLTFNPLTPAINISIFDFEKFAAQLMESEDRSEDRIFRLFALTCQVQ